MPDRERMGHLQRQGMKKKERKREEPPLSEVCCQKVNALTISVPLRVIEVKGDMASFRYIGAE